MNDSFEEDECCYLNYNPVIGVNIKCKLLWFGNSEIFYIEYEKNECFEGDSLAEGDFAYCDEIWWYSGI